MYYKSIFFYISTEDIKENPSTVTELYKNMYKHKAAKLWNTFLTNVSFGIYITYDVDLAHFIFWKDCIIS